MGSRRLALVAGSIHNVKPTMTDKQLCLQVHRRSGAPDPASFAGPVDIVGYTCMEHAALGKAIGGALHHVGNLDCDLMVSPEGCCVLELNPRFGGGYPFSHAAGANLPAALVAWIAGENADPAWFTSAPNVLSSKCDRLIVHHQSENRSAPCQTLSSSAPAKSLR